MDSHNADSWTSQDSMVRFKLESSTMGSTTFSSVSTSWRNFLFFTLPWSCQDWELCHFLNKHHGSDFGASLEVKSTKPVNLFRRPSFGYSKFEVSCKESKVRLGGLCYGMSAWPLYFSMSKPKNFLSDKQRWPTSDPERAVSIYLPIHHLPHQYFSFIAWKRPFSGADRHKTYPNRLTSALEKSVCTW